MGIVVRFVERPLDEVPLEPQVDAVQSSASLRDLEIGDTGIEMLTALVGRGMSPSQRRIVAPSLREILNGQLPRDEDAQGNLFTEVYGEIFGPLLTSLERGGDHEIIRLVAPAKRRCPDMLLVGADGTVTLQECKASFCDFNAVRNKPSSLDVCQRMRDHRNDGKDQLVWPDPGSIASRRIRVTSDEEVTWLPIACAEKAVVVTAVPDGRLRERGFQVEAPPRGACANPCTHGCMFTPEPALISVLSCEPIDMSEPPGQGGRAFLDWYKACERAIWGNAHGSFGGAYSSLLRSVQDLGISSERTSQALPLLTDLIEGAVSQAVFVDFRPIWRVCEELQWPELIMALRELHDTQGDVSPPHIRESSPSQLGRVLLGRSEEPSLEEGAVGNWTFRARHAHAERGEGTAVEAHVRHAQPGWVEAHFVPRGAADTDAMDDLCWSLAEMLAGEATPPEIVHEMFAEEMVGWTRTEEGETSVSRLGMVLDTWWPWPWVLDPRLLREMRHCCPACYELARIVEHYPNWHTWRHCYRHWRTRHRHTSSWGEPGGPVAFVTKDARAILRVPTGMRS